MVRKPVCFMCGESDTANRRILALYATDAAELPALVACVPCLLAEVAACLKLTARQGLIANHYAASVYRELGAAIIPVALNGGPDSDSQPMLPMMAEEPSTMTPMAYST